MSLDNKQPNNGAQKQQQQLDYEIKIIRGNLNQSQQSGNIRYTNVIKSTNEVVILINVESGKNPLIHNAFLVFVSIITENVRVLQLRVIDPLTLKYSVDQNLIGNFNLKEHMNHLVLSQTESSFLIHGQKHLYVGNITGLSSDNEFIDLQPIDQKLYEGMVMQAEFSVLNPNYLIILNGQCNKLYLIDTHDLNNSEQIFDLNQMIEDNNNAKQPNNIMSQIKKDNKDKYHQQYVSFAQAHNHNAIGIQAFNILLLTQQGDIYQMCPIFPREIITSREALSNLIQYLENKKDELVDDLQNDDNLKNGADEVSLLLNLIFEGIQKNDDSFVANICINLKDDKYQKYLNQLQPYLQGPLEIQFSDQPDQPTNFSRIIMIKELPFSFVRVSDQSLDLIISFYQPELIFNNINNIDFSILNDTLRLMSIGHVQFPQQQLQGNNNSSLNYVHQNVLDSTELFMQNETSLFKIDASFLQILEDKFYNDEVINPSDFQKRLTSQLLIDSDLLKQQHFGFYEILGNIQLYIAQNPQKPKDLIFTLHASLLLDSDKVLQQLDQTIKEAETVVLYENTVAKIQPIPFIDDVKIPEFQFDQSKLTDQQYVTQCISKLRNFIIAEYIPQYEDVDEILDEKVEYLNKLKEHYFKLAKSTQSEKSKNEVQKQELEQVLKKVQSNNQTIQQKIQDVQKKLNGLRAISNDEFVIQFYVDKLEHQIKETKMKLEKAKLILEDKQKQDDDIIELVKGVKKFESQKDLQEFVMKTRIDLDNLQRKVDNLKERKI